MNFVSTIFLVGLNWMVQIVHYPLFSQVGYESFVEYQKCHQTLITPLVGPMMLIELVTAVLLVGAQKSRSDTKTNAIIGLILVVTIWLSTALIQVPCHEKLLSGFNPDVQSNLVNSNWIRTLAWTARGAIVSWMLKRALDDSKNNSNTSR